MPPFDTLIDAPALQQLMRAGSPLVLLDCGFDLFDPEAGARAYAQGHLPGAHHAHLDRDLAGPKTGRNGRHPLPARDALAARSGQWGLAPGVQAVCYDDQGGVYAARAWWLLRWLGHDEVAVLDGGRAAWLAAAGALETAVPVASAGGPYPARPPGMPSVDADALLATLPRRRVLDARAPERFRGETEPLDPVAGPIPGARNRVFKLNLAADGRFKPPAQLRQEFEALDLGEAPVHQCGSGVTACHNLLAMRHAGLPDGLLYPGSWSEWCSDPARPVERG